ncbi:MAG: hypothetical protein HQL47_09720 [Gammaproteobacteria bacterium]|nr:hypothetical protein [Gammaproteobacteria bacterium]
MKPASGLIALLLALAPSKLLASPLLDDALLLVRDNCPGYRGKAELVQIEQAAPLWEAKLRAGYALAATSDEAEGFNAGLVFSLPLDQTQRRRAQAQAREAAALAAEACRQAFLADLALLRQAALQLPELAQTLALKRDRALYQEDQIEQGLVEQDRLWADIEARTQAEQASRRARRKLAVDVELIARKHGGDEWKPLQALLVALTK